MNEKLLCSIRMCVRLRQQTWVRCPLKRIIKILLIIQKSKYDILTKFSLLNFTNQAISCKSIK